MAVAKGSIEEDDLTLFVQQIIVMTCNKYSPYNGLYREPPFSGWRYIKGRDFTS